VRTHRRSAVAAALAALAIAAAPIGQAAAETIQVTIKGLAFSPTQITAHVGDTIKWVNDDFVAHTATARNGAWDINLAPHATGQIVLKRAGTVAFYCRYHPNMQGEIMVAPQ